MTTKAKIKVIKKSEMKKIRKPEIIEKKSKQEVAREMVSTVSEWVSDLQKRKRGETKQAIEKFFSNNPQANGA